MAKWLIIVSLVVLVAAAGLGFKTKQLVDGKLADLAQTKSTLATTEKNLSNTKKELATTQDNLSTAMKEIENKKGEIAGLNTELTASKAETEKALATVKEKETMLAELNQKIIDMTPKAPDGQVADLPAMIAALQTEISDTKNKLAEANVAKEAFAKQKAAADDQVVAVQKELQRYKVPIAQRGLTGRVMQVNQGWNFVVLNVGDQEKVSVNSPLLVIRDGQMVARLKVTSVEPRTSIADIVPGTVAKGNMVVSGDRVVFAGARGDQAGSTDMPAESAPAMPQGSAPQARVP